jgi:uncharacterized protein
MPGLAQSVEKALQQPLMGSEAAPELPTDVAQTLPEVADQTIAGAGADGIFRVLVFGDALAGGMGAGMSRMSEAQPDIEVVNRFNELSGLARPEFYDWATTLPKITMAKSYDAAVLMLGTNDRQAIRSGDGSFEFGSPEWRDAYAAQIDRLLDVLKSQGLRVYLVSLPPMAAPSFDADMQVISDIQRAHVQKSGGTFIDIRPFFVGSDGVYVERGPDSNGTIRKLREGDGISFMKQGNNRLGQVVLEAVLKAEAGAKPAAPVVAPEIAPVIAAAEPAVIQAPVVATLDTTLPAPEAAPQTGPLFGQQGSNGEDIAFDASAVVPVKPRLSVAQQQKIVEPIAGLANLKIVAAQGTSAERLFTTGEAGDAPPGRFDDDSFTAQPE